MLSRGKRGSGKSSPAMEAGTDLAPPSRSATDPPPPREALTSLEKTLLGAAVERMVRLLAGR